MSSGAVSLSRDRVDAAQKEARSRFEGAFIAQRALAVRDLNRALVEAQRCNNELRRLHELAERELGKSLQRLDWLELAVPTPNHASRLTDWQRFVAENGVAI